MKCGDGGINLPVASGRVVVGALFGLLYWRIYCGHIAEVDQFSFKMKNSEKTKRIRKRLGLSIFTAP